MSILSRAGVTREPYSCSDPHVIGELEGLSSDDREAVLDVAQLTLDVIGVFEPTPFADGTNAILSLVRGDMLGALMSAVGVVPYVGDLAKLGKLGRHAATLDRVIRLTARDARLAERLRPMLSKLLGALEHLPVAQLPSGVRAHVDEMTKALRDSLDGGARAAMRLERLTDDVLVRAFGSAQNIGTRQRGNVRVAVAFFDKHNVGNRDVAHWVELLKGIDTHAIEPVSVVRLRAGDLVGQYVELARPADRRVGQWMKLARGSVSHENLGLAGGGRSYRLFRVRDTAGELEVLKSKAAPAADHWTSGATRSHTAMTTEGGVRKMKRAEQVAGGGDQYFLPNAWEHLEPTSVGP